MHPVLLQQSFRIHAKIGIRVYKGPFTNGPYEIRYSMETIQNALCVVVRSLVGAVREPPFYVIPACLCGAPVRLQ